MCVYKYCAQLCLHLLVLYTYIYIGIYYIHTLNSSFSLVSLVFFFPFLFRASQTENPPHARTRARIRYFLSIVPSLLPSFLPISLSSDYFFFPSNAPLIFHIPYFISPPIPSLPQQPPRLLSSFPDLCFPPANSSN